MSWFRVHTTMRNNPKMLLLSDRDHRALVNLWCVAKDGNGSVPCLPIIAIELRCQESKARTIMTSLIRAGFFYEQEDGTFLPHDWNEHQYISDVSSGRVKQFRDRQRNVSGNVSETPSETDYRLQTTEEEKTPTESKRKPASPKDGSATTHGSRFTLESIPMEWLTYSVKKLNWTAARAESEFEEFRDYWIGEAGAKARKANWFATWRSRCRQIHSRAPRAGPTLFPARPSFTENVAGVIADRISRGERPL